MSATHSRSGPDRLWVADITYCRTFAGWVYGWYLKRLARGDVGVAASTM